MSRINVILRIILFCAALSCTRNNEKIQPIDLRAEYLENPIAVGTKTPRLTWHFDGENADLKISKVEVNIWKNPKQKGEPIHIVKNDWQAKWITDNRDKEYEPAPLFRKNIKVSGKKTAQALALYLGLPPEGKEKQVAGKLHELVAGNNYFLDFGVIGSKTVPRMLTQYGYVEDAMKMVTKTDVPSWGYWVDKLGYTTLAEEWVLDPVKNGTSLNHVFLGDVSAWMINQLAGINYDP